MPQKVSMAADSEHALVIAGTGVWGGIPELLQRSIGLEGLRDVLGALCFQ